MQHSPHDLRDYVLGELDRSQTAEVERYLAASAEARDEVARLRLTEQALRSLPEEEPPRRIAFVSDKVFEPSPWARFRNWIWAEGPRTAFGAAALAAVLFAGAAMTEPRVSWDDGGFELAFGPAPESVAAPVVERAGLDEETVRGLVSQAVAEAVARDREETLRLVANRIGGSQAQWRQALAEHRQDTEAAWMLVNKHLNEIEKRQFQMAGVR